MKYQDTLIEQSAVHPDWSSLLEPRVSFYLRNCPTIQYNSRPVIINPLHKVQIFSSVCFFQLNYQQVTLRIWKCQLG